MNNRRVVYPYPLCNNCYIYCIEIWYDEEVEHTEYYYFNSFKEAKEQFLMWCDSKYIRNNYK